MLWEIDVDCLALNRVSISFLLRFKKHVEEGVERVYHVEECFSTRFGYGTHEVTAAVANCIRLEHDRRC